jgi:hypothetical protein
MNIAAILHHLSYAFQPNGAQFGPWHGFGREQWLSMVQASARMSDAATTAHAPSLVRTVRGNHPTRLVSRQMFVRGHGV